MSTDLVPINPAMLDIARNNTIEFNNLFTEEILLIDILLASVPQEGEILNIVNKMKPGDELELLRVADDINPAQIIAKYEGNYVGEIPMENGIILSRLMDAGKKLVCKINKASTHKAVIWNCPFTRILAKIYLID